MAVSLQNDRAPESEIPSGAIAFPLPRVIDSENFTPRLLALLSNSLVWRESRALRARFGLGTNEWRVIAAIAVNPGMNASEISEFLVLNKAIVSKSVSVLTDSGLILQADVAGRARPLYLTQTGAETHDAMLPISLRGQDVILEGLTPEQVDQFNALLRTLLAKARDLQIGDALEALEETENA